MWLGKRLHSSFTITCISVTQAMNRSNKRQSSTGTSLPHNGKFDVPLELAVALAHITLDMPMSVAIRASGTITHIILRNMRYERV